MLQISPSAANEIKRIQKYKKQPGNLLKLSINSGGCSGLFYALQLENATNLKQENALSSQPLAYKDHSVEVDGIKIFVDDDSRKYIENLKIDYAEDLMGGGFRFYNPQAKNVCGCGISFVL